MVHSRQRKAAEKMFSHYRSTESIFTVLLLTATSVAVGCSSAEPPDESVATTIDNDSIDLIIAGDYVVTMDPDSKIIAAGAVAIDGGLIIAIGTAAEINTQYTAEDHLPGDNRIDD